MNFEELIDALKCKNYDNAYKIVELLKGKLSINTYNYFKFMIALMYKRSNGSHKYAWDYTFESIIPTSEEEGLFSNREAEEKIRKLVFSRMFFKAGREIDALGEENEYYDVCKTLLRLNIELQRATINVNMTLLQEDKLEEYIESKSKQIVEFGGTHFQKCELQIAKDLLALRQNNGIVASIKPTPYIGNSLFGAIYEKNYHKALEENTRYLESKGRSLESNELQLLLTIIVKELKDIAEETEKENISFNNIRDSFLFRKLDLGFSQVIKYLKAIGQSDYEFLIVSLFNIGLIDDDYTFSEAFNILKALPNFDFNTLKAKFNLAIKSHQWEKAEIYLSIICHYTILDSKEYEQMKSELSSVIPKVSSYKLHWIYRNFIIQKAEDALYHGVVLLENSGKLISNKFYNAAKGLSNIQVFKTGSFDERRVAIRHIKTEKINLGEAYSEIRKAYYDEKDYDKAKNIGITLLQSAQCPPWIYAIIGFSYYHIHKYARAIQYLTIATAQSANSKEISNDHTELLILLKQKISKSKLQIFIDHINQNIESGMELEDACIASGISPTQRLLIMLMYAKESLMLGDEELATYYLSRVMAEKSDDAIVNSLLQDILRNMDIYQSIEEECIFKRIRN